jgi:hypothetical protein
MTVYVADEHTHVQRLVSVVKMATILESSFLRSLWAIGFNVKVIHKEMFPVYGGNCWSRKAVPSWVEEFCQDRSKVSDDVTKVRN